MKTTYTFRFLMNIYIFLDKEKKTLPEDIGRDDRGDIIDTKHHI